MSNQFEFISTDPSISLKPGKSSLIRSRCMQGKNKRESSRRSQRAIRRAAATHKAESSTKPDLPSVQAIPPSLNDFALIRFASDIDAEAQGLIFKAFTYNVANPPSPLDRCVDFDYIESASFQWYFSDAVFLHSILFVSYAINDLVLPSWDGQPGRKMVSHLRKTLALLARKMETINVHEDEAVLHVVINLALLAVIYDDWKAAAAHFAGLQKIVQLRGGVDFLRSRPKLHLKLDRLDLAWSLSSGNNPFFLLPITSWEPILQLRLSDSSLYQPPADWDIRLADLFRDFQLLAVTINENVRKHARYNAACFQTILSSLQSRLMYLESPHHDSIEELVRLSLLALLTTTFEVPGRKIPYIWVAKKIEKAYIGAIDSINKNSKALQLWLLMVVAISVTRAEEDWFREAWRAAGIAVNWAEAKKHLTNVIWIECIHDRAGKTVLQQLTITREAADWSMGMKSWDPI
ncbi:uncharacterized protein K460DRAFT_330563 [Cucurbitaria berberidis CBS 394.84]|uniref:Transcription factor domain-containing protein n=1 Tax=Cucurbitaria berberidis CBS 394.84 TaxID=1168544 RepID=A0A9P4GPH9_9PLEO|nr:uncharacterized protein K460DRAFT_330563 [Cucurbitaria berberidis CBS 394.84]KAF1849031.1 hypothetical protein K460DRAFT_330563 [Cucurbitaria berberidis CBS 394.84]